MRLKQIKLAGFKSFVDPTTVTLPSNLCAVVGPNGCGKSNIIDAVRWVMGESSAKNLRGESMSDVIFNGSGSRKPVGQASIELVFDNSDGTIKGEYAGFSEIAVRRKVTRDGQNNYYLNGSKCRRRDIVDIFLGTGLGPRSYAIIEQGMISRLIEAKPEELRIYIEEAAGISKYKERRRDTENRMRRTKENLERLTDIREELERQLIRLERQAKAAERYAELKKEERDVKAHLAALRYQLLDKKLQEKQHDISERELAIEGGVTQRVNHETAMEKFREAFTEQNDTFNEVQGRYYGLGTEIARIEQNIQNIQERHKQLTEEIATVEEQRQSTQSHLQTDQSKIEAWEVEIAEIEPQLDELREVETDSSAVLLESEEAMQDWQQRWDSFNQQASIPRQRAEVEQSKIQHLEQVQSRLLERIQRLDDEISSLQADESEDEDLLLLKEDLAEQQLALEEKAESVEGYTEQISILRERANNVNEQLSDARGKLQTAEARFASLEALQQGALSNQKAVNTWLNDHDLADKPRLISKISVNDTWQTAVEVVLGDAIQAVCVDDLSSMASLLTSLDQGELVVIDHQKTPGAAPNQWPSLVDQVSGDADVISLLSGVYLSDNLLDALKQRDQLKASESFITPEGIWLGNNWMKVKRQSDEEGVIARQAQMDQLKQDIAETDEQVAALSESRQTLADELAQAEADAVNVRRELDSQRQQFHQQESQFKASQVRQEQTAVRRQKALDEQKEAKEQLDLEAESLSESRVILQEAIESMEEDTEKKETLLTERDNIRTRLDDIRQRARHDKDKVHALAIRHQSVKTQLDSIRGSTQRLKEQIAHLDNRLQPD